VLGALLRHENIGRDAAAAAMSTILAGDATASQLTAFIVGLRSKGEAPDELAGMLDAVHRAALRVPLPTDVLSGAIDIVGTGGDGSHSVNVSTMAALVLAGGGVPVCKHGNRAASSACGSADVLEELGVVLDLDPAGVARCVVESGFGFCFAPKFHPAFRHAGPSRREIGVPTSFNLLGPLANPAGVPFMLVGVGAESSLELMAATLAEVGVRKAWVVHGAGGFDELSTYGPSRVLEVTGSEIRPFVIDPTDLALVRGGREELRGGDAATNAAVVRRVFEGERGPVRDVVLLNAAAGFVIAGRSDDIGAGLEAAAASIDDGRAARSLERLVEVSREAAAG
jgi:anthranilate phosphoribosyltransferase